jgi:hypothetical protein
VFDIETEGLDADGVLTAADALQRSLNQAEAAKLLLACRWADLNTCIGDDRALPGAERMVVLGGEGTPAIAEFAPAELGPACGESAFAGRCLIADALDLRHRHPLLWARVQAGQVKAHVARRIVQTTRNHSRDIAMAMDKMVAPYADRKSAGELEKICEAHIIRLDPAGAKQRAERSESDQGVWVSPSSDHGTRDIFIRTTSAAAAFFDARVDRIADDLAVCGDTTSKDVRRASAVGMIGSQDSFTLSADPIERVAQQSASKVTLYVHLTDDAITTNQGVARIEGSGPITVDQVRRWLGHSQVTVKPVIDLMNQASVDGYEVPDRLREAVHLISPTDCFPFASNQRRRKDIDHTTAFDPHGPPGQTRLGNLGPLTRFHHRIKTHTGWETKQPFPGIFIWRSPVGRYYLVDNTGTRPLTTTA